MTHVVWVYLSEIGKRVDTLTLPPTTPSRYRVKYGRYNTPIYARNVITIQVTAQRQTEFEARWPDEYDTMEVALNDERPIYKGYRLSDAQFVIYQLTGELP